MPTTSTINTLMYDETFAPHLKAGKDILYLCFSSALSSSYENAQFTRDRLMARYPGRRIVVVDSRSAAVGEGMILLAAYEQYLSLIHIFHSGLPAAPFQAKHIVASPLQILIVIHKSVQKVQPTAHMVE